MRFKHYSLRTEQTYWLWIKGFILFHKKRHPREMGGAEIQSYLSYLAVERNVAAATQNQVLNALVFLYREVLGREPGSIGAFARPTRKPKLPSVLSREETSRLRAAIAPDYQLLAQLLYGPGMRLMECLRLRTAQ